MNSNIVVQVNPQLSIYACLSSSYIYILQKDRYNFRVQSEQPIIFLQKGPIVNSIIVINRSHHWQVFKIQQQPTLYLSGMIKLINHQKIVNVHYYKTKILFLMDSQNIYYLSLKSPSSVKKLVDAVPDFQNHHFLTKQYLLSAENHRVILSQLINNTLYIVFQSINQVPFYALFTAHLQDQGLLSGRQAIINIKQRPLSIIMFKQCVAIQTCQEILLIQQNGVKCYSDYKFRSSVTKFTNKQGQFLYYGVATNRTLVDVIVQISLSKCQLLFRQISGSVLKDKRNIHNSIIKVFPNTKEGFYALNQKHEFLSLDNPEQKLTENLIVQLTQAHLKTSKMSNVLFYSKKVGQSLQKFAMTSQLVTSHFERYKHGIFLKQSRCFFVKQKIYFTSALIGTLGLQIQVKGSDFRIGSLKTYEEGQQSLFLKGDLQITSLKFYDKKEVKLVSELFDNICSWANHGIVISNFLVLAYGQQLHFFNINDKLKRVFIHCFESQISSVAPLNDINVIGCRLWQNACTQIMIIKEDRLEFVRQQMDMPLNELLSFSINVNTVPYICSLFKGKILFCSNQQVHKYQPQKVVIQVLEIPEFPRCKLCPIFCIDSKSHQFFLYDKSDSVARVMSINEKNLVKELKQIQIEYEQILALPLFEQKYYFACRSNQNLLLFGEQQVFLCCLNSGRIRVKDNAYLKKWVNIQQNKLKVNNWHELGLGNNQTIKCIPINQDRALIYNSSQLWLCSLSFLSQSDFQIEARKVSYFGMNNETVLSFRNNLTVNQLNNAQFMDLFNTKMNISSVRYLTSRAIFVLYQTLIAVVQITHNQALALRQQIKFADNDHIKIVQLLDSFDQTGIFIKDNQGRLFVLKESTCDGNLIYSIQFAENLEDDIICVGRLQNWNEKSRKISIGGDKNTIFSRLLVKKDGQLTLGDSSKLTFL